MSIFFEYIDGYRQRCTGKTDDGQLLVGHLLGIPALRFRRPHETRNGWGGDLELRPINSDQ